VQKTQNVFGYVLHLRIRGRNQKFPDSVGNEIYAYLSYYSLRSNINDYGGKTHYTDSQNSAETTPSGRELYHLQFLLQAASPETFWIHPRTFRTFLAAKPRSISSGAPRVMSHFVIQKMCVMAWGRVRNFSATL
jgi:hypothetical protein